MASKLHHELVEAICEKHNASRTRWKRTYYEYLFRRETGREPPKAHIARKWDFGACLCDRDEADTCDMCNASLILDMLDQIKMTPDAYRIDEVEWNGELQPFITFFEIEITNGGMRTQRLLFKKVDSWSVFDHYWPYLGLMQIISVDRFGNEVVLLGDTELERTEMLNTELMVRKLARTERAQSQ